ncbi:MAG: hypothetical protein ABIR56_03760 [Polaromonas sp.]
MNKAKLKSYAPQARQDFIAAVAARANLLGLSEKAGQLEVAPSQPQGDITVIACQPWPAKVHGQRALSSTAGNLHKPHYQGAYMRLVDGNSEAEKMSMMAKAIAQSKLA